MNALVVPAGMCILPLSYDKISWSLLGAHLRSYIAGYNTCYMKYADCSIRLYQYNLGF